LIIYQICFFIYLFFTDLIVFVIVYFTFLYILSHLLNGSDITITLTLHD